MTQSYYTSEHIGQSQFYYWYGQVLGDWEGNENDKIHYRNDIPGWGKRYKVAILGRDLRSVDKGTDNNQIAMAEVLLPVTAGSGLGGGVQTPNISQNTFVVGFYKDGINCREPIIMGLLPNFTQTLCKSYNGNNQERFNPASGFNPANQSHPIPEYNLWTEKFAHIIKESNDGGFVNGLDVRNIKQLQDATPTDYIPKTYKCDSKGGEMAGIAKVIQDAINLINRIKNEVLGFSNAISSVQTTIKSVTNTVTLFVSYLMKNMMQRMREYTHNQINKAVALTLNIIPPNLRYTTMTGIKKSSNTINCIFNKLIGGLVGLVGKLINKLINGAVNAAMCAVENFVGGVLSNILGDITNGINSALNTIGKLLGKPLQFAGKVLDVLNMLFGFLKFFSCEEELKCPSVDKWSFWYGTSDFSQKVSNKVGDILNTIATNSGITSASDGGASSSCSTGPVLCGPPTLELLGGGGSGFKANAIISNSGSLLGFDIINPGFGYESTPIANFSSNCGIGNGASILPYIEDPMVEGYSITGIGTGSSIEIDTTQANSEGTLIITEGGAIVTVNGSLVTSGGVGDPIIVNGLSVNAGGSGGIPVVAGGIGGTSLTLKGFELTADGSRVTIGAVGGIPVVTSTGIPVFAGSTDGTPVVSYIGNVSESTNVLSSSNVVSTANSGKITDVIVLDSGVGYLPYPNGSTGGGGQVFSKPNQTVAYTPSTGQYDVFVPGELVEFEEGDLIYPPSGTVTDLYDEDGNVIQTINGLGQITPIKIKKTGVLTIPEKPEVDNVISPDPTKSDGSYPVVLSLKKVLVVNEGFNYNKNDKISISPSKGAELEPKYDDFGRLISVNIIKNGIGFTEIPTIYIDSESGVNARMIPLFNVIRVGDLPENQDIVPIGTPIINVVDCVGRVI